jgi:hypothetical protein
LKSIAAHVAQHAIPVDGPIREFYLVGPQDRPDETAWRTEIGWPVFHTIADAEHGRVVVSQSVRNV